MASPAVASLGTQWQGEEERVLCTPLTASGASDAEVARVGIGKGQGLTRIQGLVFGNDFHFCSFGFNLFEQVIDVWATM